MSDVNTDTGVVADPVVVEPVTPAQPDPLAEIKAWVRREMYLAATGHQVEDRVLLNP